MSDLPILDSPRAARARSANALRALARPREEWPKSQQERSFSGMLARNRKFSSRGGCGENMGKSEQKPEPSISEASRSGGKRGEISTGSWPFLVFSRLFNGNGLECTLWVRRLNSGQNASMMVKPRVGSSKGSGRGRRGALRHAQRRPCPAPVLGGGPRTRQGADSPCPAHDRRSGDLFDLGQAPSLQG
jgi:hypothetical protein